MHGATGISTHFFIPLAKSVHQRLASLMLSVHSFLWRASSHLSFDSSLKDCLGNGVVTVNIPKSYSEFLMFSFICSVISETDVELSSAKFVFKGQDASLARILRLKSTIAAS